MTTERAETKDAMLEESLRHVVSSPRLDGASSPHLVPSTEHRAPCTVHRAPSSGCRVPRFSYDAEAGIWVPRDEMQEESRISR